MSYNILQARIEYKADQIDRITVLVEISPNDVRAIFATTNPRNGYMNIPRTAVLNEALLQQVAGYGSQTIWKDEIFPKWGCQ